MKVARCGELWNASRIVTLLRDKRSSLFASGRSDPDLSLAASVHLFASAGLSTPAALDGPQYLADRGSMDPIFRADADVILLPTAPGLGLKIPERVEVRLTLAAKV